MIGALKNFEGLNITFNTNEDCNLACKYCVQEGTKILMGDLTEKNIEDVKPGDIIIGFDEKNTPYKSRKMQNAVVLAGGFTKEVDYYYIFKTKNTSVALSATHPVIDQRNMFVEAEKFYYSKEKNKRISVDYIPRKRPIVFSYDYKIGYIIACLVRGDTARKDKSVSTSIFLTANEEIVNRLEQFMLDFGFEMTVSTSKISKRHSNPLKTITIFYNTSDLNKILFLILLNIVKNENGLSLDYYRGFFAGLYDIKGKCSQDNYRIVNKDPITINELKMAIQKFYENKVFDVPVGDAVTISERPDGTIPLITVTLMNECARKIIEYTQPACTKKFAVVEGKSPYSRKSVTIEKINKKTRMYNLTTSTHTFIANGVMVHNCYEIEKKHRILSLDYAKKFIDIVLSDPDPIGCIGTKDDWLLDQGLILDFIGGDSFMHIDLVDKIIKYFIYRINTITPNHKWANNWRVSISSNGTLFEKKECRDFIKRWREVLSLGISIDGCPTIHDKNRIFAERGPNGEEIGSMETIRKWWPWLRKMNWTICRSTKATCARDSIPYLFESLKYMYEELGISHINQNFIMEETGCTDEDYKELENQFDKCIEYVLNHRNSLYWSMLDERFLKRISDPDVYLDEGWCGSGAMPALAVNGKIYPCFRWLPHTQEDEKQSEAFCVGDIWNGFNRKENFRKVREATRINISPPECLECEYEPCCSYCLTPNTPILMADFTQKAIKDVIPDDSIVGFDEFPMEQGTKRKYRIAVVEKTFEHEIDEDIYFNESGYGFTGDHPFLTKKRNDLRFDKIENIVTNGQNVFKSDIPSLTDEYFDFNHCPEIPKSSKISFTKAHYKGTVHNLKTSTHTYIGGGLLCHNCLGGCYSEYGCFKRTTHICDITKIQAQAAEKYWKAYDKLEGTNHFLNRSIKENQNKIVKRSSIGLLEKS